MKTSNVAVAVVVIAVIAVAAVTFLFLNGPSGTLVIGVTDSPLNSNVTHVYLTINSITLQGETNSTTTTYKVISTQFDLLKLTNVTKFLGSDKIPVGNYTMVRFSVTSAVATISGANVTLTVPSGEVKVPIHFQVQSGKTTTVVLDITADMTNISASKNFRPVVTVKSVGGPA